MKLFNVIGCNFFPAGNTVLVKGEEGRGGGDCVLRLLATHSTQGHSQPQPAKSEGRHNKKRRREDNKVKYMKYIQLLNIFENPRYLSR